MLKNGFHYFPFEKTQVLKVQETGFSEATEESWPIQKVQWKRKDMSKWLHFSFMPRNILVWWLLWGYWERWDGWQYHSTYPVPHFWGFQEPRSSCTEVLSALWHELSSFLRESWMDLGYLRSFSWKSDPWGKVGWRQENLSENRIKPHNLTVKGNQAPALCRDTEVWCKS